MPFRNIADSEQLAVLRKALAEVCFALDVRPTDVEGREEIAERILWHHGNGVETLEHLKRNVLSERKVRLDE